MEYRKNRKLYQAKPSFASKASKDKQPQDGAHNLTDVISHPKCLWAVLIHFNNHSSNLKVIDLNLWLFNKAAKCKNPSVQTPTEKGKITIHQLVSVLNSIIAKNGALFNFKPQTTSRETQQPQARPLKILINTETVIEYLKSSTFCRATAQNKLAVLEEMREVGRRAQEIRMHREISSRSEFQSDDPFTHLDTEDIQSMFDCCISQQAIRYKIINNKQKLPQVPRTYHKVYTQILQINSPTLAKPGRLRAESSDQTFSKATLDFNNFGTRLHIQTEEKKNENDDSKTADSQAVTSELAPPQLFKQSSSSVDSQLRNQKNSLLSPRSQLFGRKIKFKKESDQWSESRKSKITASFTSQPPTQASAPVTPVTNSEGIFKSTWKRLFS